MYVHGVDEAKCRNEMNNKINIKQVLRPIGAWNLDTLQEIMKDRQTDMTDRLTKKWT